MSGSRNDAGLAWAGRAAGHLAGGAVGGALVWLLLSILAELRSSLPVVVVGTALAVAAVGLPLWWVVLRPPRTGPWWGGLVAAWIPAAIVAALGLATAVAGDSTARRVPRHGRPALSRLGAADGGSGGRRSVPRGRPAPFGRPLTPTYAAASYRWRAAHLGPPSEPGV